MRREQFIPDTVWVWGDEGWMVPLRRQDDPERWEQLCDSDEAIVTQVDDGTSDKGLRPTSSSSAPSLMRRMIDVLGAEPGMRVLEIGTGTGYNAAMLAEITGSENVTSVEVDEEIAGHARRALRAAGFPVHVITGDGLSGYPGNAPYERVIVTASVRDIPYAWVAQTSPGGRMVIPWGSDLDVGGVLLVLEVGEEGIARGRFGDGVAFMRVREQRPRSVPWVEDTYDGDFVQTTTSADPREAFALGADARFAVGAVLHEFTAGCTRNEDGSFTFRLSHAGSGSWAAFTPGESGEHVVRQHGPRRLWDELEAVYGWWLEAGKPGPGRFGMTVATQGQTIWLDSPANPIV